MDIVKLSRREMIAASLASAAFVLGVGPVAAADAAKPVEIQPLLSVLPNGRVQIVALLAEMGQGVSTAMPLILAEELDVDWSDVDIVPFRSGMATPPAADPGMLIAASSRSIRAWFTPLRQCAARARSMLVSAAAAQWDVAPDTCRTDRGWVVHPDGQQRVAYRSLATAAARLTPPAEVALKPIDRFRLIGKIAERRDVPAKCTGAAIYASDVKLPGMLYASLMQGPLGGAELLGFDEKAALALPRVRQLFVIDASTLVAIAEDTWSAMRALEAAAPRYKATGKGVSSEVYRRALKEALPQKGRSFAVKGATPMEPNLRRVEVEYGLPFLAHATMEPMCCTAWHKGSSCEVWAPTQAVFAARKAAAEAGGLAVAAVTVNQTLLGGGFGRRSQSDFVRQAVQISNLTKRPVRLTWSRAEDMQHDYYRPAYAMRCSGALDDRGRVADYAVTIAGPSILRSRVPAFAGPNAPIDPTTQSGLVPTFYDLPNSRAAWVEVDSPIRVGYWRSVAHSQNLFAAESFIDELAHAAGEDPFDFRRKLVTDPRMLAVMDKLRTLSNWDTPPAQGRGRGVALVYCYESYFGQVIEASVEAGEIRVHRVTNVIDCGIAVQPDNVVAQVEGGAIFGLSAAIYGEIDVEDGSVTQSSFGDYRVLLLTETPVMTTHITRSTAAPGGVGETGTPTCAPALANALFALTGRRVRSLPLAKAFAPAS